MRDCNLALPRPERGPLKARVVVDRERSVIREALVLVDRDLLRPRRDARSGDLIVDAPTHVFRPGLAAVRPPGVLLRPRVDAAEHVDPAHFIENLGEPGALLGKEARVLPVRAPVLQVDLLVGDVPVAAEHELAAARDELFQHRCEFLEEPELGLLPFLRARPGRQVHRYHRKPAEIGAEETPFGIELAAAEAAGYALGFGSRVQRDAAVALLRRATVIVAVVSLRDEREVSEVRFLRLDFLHAYDSGALAREPPREALGERRADAVEVERDNA